MELNNKIEHTLLKANTTKEEVATVCKEAIEHNFIGVCVPPYYVKQVKSLLEGTQVQVVTVVGFPLGYQVTPAKVEETRKALEDGADEIDMVINIASLKSGDIKYLTNDIKSISTFVHLKGKVIKVIIETALLNETEIQLLCKICAEIGVDYVKTSTGFSTEGATIEHVKLMRQSLPDKIKIKASGGIKTKEFAVSLVSAGANRLGTSSGLSLVQ